MNAPSRHTGALARLSHAAAVVCVAIAMVLGISGPVLAADWADFGTPTADGSFIEGVDFRQPVTLDGPLTRAELLVTVGNAIGPTVIPVDAPSEVGTSTLTYHFDAALDGQLVPNTRLIAQWRLVAAGDPNDVALGPAIEVFVDDERFAWQTVSGDLVRVHWYEGPAAFGARALQIGEDAVRDAAGQLGVTESEPIDFFVYADRDPFYDALGPSTRENVGGAQIPGSRTMFALIPPDQIDDAWVGMVVPHELTHLVFETAAGNPYHFPPRWLNEGLAVYLSQGYDSSDRGLVESAASAGTLISLDGLTGQFPTSVDRFSLAYAESVSAVDFLIRTYGRDALVSLIRSYADGHTDDEAFSAAIGVDMTDLGGAWLAELGAAAPIRYGPQPAPPGPTPAAWSGTSGSNPGTGGPATASATSSSPGDTGGSAGGGGNGLWLVVLVVVVVGVVLFALVVRRRRPRADAGPN